MDLTDKNKAQVKAWLFELLSQIELVDDIIGEKSEQDNEVTIKIKFINSLVTRYQLLKNEVANLSRCKQ